MARPAVAYMSRSALRHNYLYLQKKSCSATVIAVVKADAYGHGLSFVSRALYDLGCRHFAITDVAEGVLLRNILGDGACIVVLSGIFDQREAGLCALYKLTPFVSEEKQLRWLLVSQFKAGLWLKVNSGMNRLGCQDVFSLIQFCDAHRLKVIGLCSHLACADTPAHPLNHAQVTCMLELQQTTQLPVSLLNSAGILSMANHLFDFVRPGIALYGANPLSEESSLQPVMRLCARVMQVRDVSAGAYISYGGAYKAMRNMRVALVPLGYADGLPRSLSSRGCAVFAGEALAIVGRVCMDYCLLDVSHSAVKVGDELCFWGDMPTANEVAKLANSISYTLFTGVGARVQRVLLD